MRFIAIALLSLVLAGCEVEVRLDGLDMGKTPPIKIEYPTVNLPVSLRQSNWLGNKNEGSCVHATMISLLRWQGRPNTADYWRQNYGDGEWPEDLAGKFDREGVRYAYITNGDPEFLAWACSTRRGCGVTVMGASTWLLWSTSMRNGLASWIIMTQTRSHGFPVTPL